MLDHLPQAEEKIRLDAEPRLNNMAEKNHGVSKAVSNAYPSGKNGRFNYTFIQNGLNSKQ
jgi:hypothetical protein